MKGSSFIAICFTLCVTTLFGCTNPPSQPELLRESYTSEIAGEERDYFVYLPQGYHSNPERSWPILMFLHGNGERGNGKDELGFSMIHGPLMEAWIQKKNLPFIIINPQLHTFGLDTVGIDYLTNRDLNNIPQRLEEGVPKREPDFPTPDKIEAESHVTNFDDAPSYLEFGWNRVEHDLLGMLDTVLEKYHSDPSRIYLSGLSYGGFGTWYMGSTFPDRFAAINPVVGWGHPHLMPPIAKAKLPVWVFAGGRDNAVEKKYFFEGLNVLEELGHEEVLFTIHEDMNHDIWKRVYAGDDVYTWLLEHKKTIEDS